MYYTKIVLYRGITEVCCTYNPPMPKATNLSIFWKYEQLCCLQQYFWTMWTTIWTTMLPAKYFWLNFSLTSSAISQKCLISDIFEYSNNAYHIKLYTVCHILPFPERNLCYYMKKIHVYSGVYLRQNSPTHSNVLREFTLCLIAYE